MAKKTQQRDNSASKNTPVAAAAPPPVKPTAKPAATGGFLPAKRDIIPLLACFLFFVVEFLPGFGSIDDMGTQWLYLVLLDLAVAIYIWDKKNEFEFPAIEVFKNTFSRLYIALFVVAGISVFFSINHTEGWVCYVRFIATIVGFFNISILLYNRVHLLKYIAQFLAAILVVQSIQALAVFFTEMKNYRLTDLVLALKGRAGNKNIFAASLIVKVPFVMYGIYSSRTSIGRIINVAVFFLATLTIILVNSRTSYLGLILETAVYLAFCAQQYFKERKKELMLFRTSSIILPVIAAYFVSMVAISAAKSSFVDDALDANQYGSVTERLSSITSTADDSREQRLFLWGHAISYFKSHPFMGCGYGNWKIASIPYTKYLVDDLSVPIHAHNDFLETFAELGVFGGLLYISLYVCIFIYTLRTVFSNARQEIKLLSIISFIGLTGYLIDALFNFPSERPVNQMYFILVIALNLVAFNAKKDEASEEAPPKTSPNNVKTFYAFGSILLLLPAAYITFLTYQSMVVQNRVVPDLINEPLKQPIATVINAFPTIPDLSSSAQPIDGILGRYLYEAKRYPEAIAYLDRGSKANPYIMYSEFLKADVYYADNKMDSAFKYAKLSYFTKPRAKTYYQTLVAVCARRLDSVTLKQAFKLFTTYRPKEALGYNLYLQGMINIKMNTGIKHTTPDMLFLADSVVKLFPADKELATRRNEIFTNMPANSAAGKVVQGSDVVLANQMFQEATADFNKADYANAAKKFIRSSEISQGTYGVYENIAICYFNMKMWEKSLPYFDRVLAMRTATDGKSEYFKAAALINLGRKDEACALLHISKGKNYAAADGLITTYCPK